MKQNIFNFNHISLLLNDQEVQELKDYNSKYHRKCWCYKQVYKTFRKWKIIADGSSIIFASGGLASAIATSGIALVAISSVALLIQGYIKHKNLDMNIKTCQNAYQSYTHLLNKIKNSMRTGHFSRDNLTITITYIDNMVADNCPIVDKYYNKYDKIF